MSEPVEILEKVEFRHPTPVGSQFMFKAKEMCGYGKPFSLPQKYRIRAVVRVVAVMDWPTPVVMLEVKGVGKLGLTAEAFNLSCTPI